MDEDKILITTSETGTANILVYITQLLLRENFHVRALVNKNAARIFKQREVEYSSPDETAGGLNTQNAIDFLQKENVRLIITGIMGNKSTGLDYTFIRAGKEARIQTVAFLDAWCNYANRLAAPGQSGRLAFITDRLVVMNSYALHKFESELPGLPADRMKVIGSIYYYNLLKKNNKPAIFTSREDSGSTNILFLSQPIEELYGDESSEKYLGYTQYGIIRTLVHQLEQNIPSRAYTLTIRLHPRDTELKYEKYCSGNIRLDTETRIEALINKSDLVFGMSTTALLDAVLYEKYTASVQLGLSPGKDLCVLTESGIMTPVQDERQLAKCIAGYFDIAKRNTRIGEMKNRLIPWLEVDNSIEPKIIELVENRLRVSYGNSSPDRAGN